MVKTTDDPTGEIGEWRITRYTQAIRSRRGALQGLPAGVTAGNPSEWRSSFSQAIFIQMQSISVTNNRLRARLPD